jgi:hypothetical protein
MIEIFGVCHLKRIVYHDESRYGITVQIDGDRFSGLPSFTSTVNIDAIMFIPITGQLGWYIGDGGGIAHA